AVLAWLCTKKAWRYPTTLVEHVGARANVPSAPLVDEEKDSYHSVVESAAADDLRPVPFGAPVGPPVRSTSGRCMKTFLETVASRVGGALLVVLAFGVLGSQSACSSGDDTPPGPCPPGKPCDVSLTILHTADIHSRLFPYDQVITQVDSTRGLGELNAVVNIGGVARMSYLLGRERARSGRVIHLDSGDCFQGAPIFNFFKGEPEVRAMTHLGVDAAVVGNHEFDAGAQNVATQMQRWSNFPLLAANYKYENTSNDGAPATLARLGSVTRPFTVLNVNGLKIGIIGMANVSTLSSLFDQPNRLGITPLNTVEMTQFYIDLLRPYVDLVGGVSHLGLDVDQQAIRGTTGLDFIMGGHNHIVINPPQEIRDCSADPNNPG